MSDDTSILEPKFLPLGGHIKAPLAYLPTCRTLWINSIIGVIEMRKIDARLLHDWL